MNSLPDIRNSQELADNERLAVGRFRKVSDTVKI